MKGSVLKKCKVKKLADGDYQFSKSVLPFTLVCKGGPDCQDHDWRSKRAPIRLVCKKGPGCMNHDWLNPRNPLKKHTRDEIVGTAEEI
jgi:hypothetical protein